MEAEEAPVRGRPRANANNNEPQDENRPNRQVKDDLAVRVQDLFTRFLNDFHEPDSDVIKYLQLIEEIANEPNYTTLNISLVDLEQFNEYLGEKIVQEYYRVLPYLQTAAERILIERAGHESKKELYIAFTDSKNPKTIRSLRADDIGIMSSLSGQVVRTHPVMPELVEAVFKCLECETKQPAVPQQFTYTQPQQCVNDQCANRSRWELDLDESSFVDFQKIRIQEIHDDLPRGSIPRSMDVIVRGDAVEKAQAGDQCRFTGCLIVVPDVGSLVARGSGAGKQLASTTESLQGVTGLKALGVRELNYRFSYLAYAVESTDSKLSEKVSSMMMSNRGEKEVTQADLATMLDIEDWRGIEEMLNDPKLLINMCHSIFPSIHGHDDVKKGILLMLMGGVPKKTNEGTTLRGDLNVCLVGDPSTAKSQMLKTVEDFSPKCFYTSGKASSAAGLTAAVVKDEESGEFTIEAGALLLADNGIACIDEFDKMDVKDQVAIHEAMEQQTITITKAGVKATLKSRTSILAAANPVGGRYDKSKQLRHNISLTAPIMSRFDLFFVMIDEANELVDYAIAKSIVDLHSVNIEERFEHNRVYSVDMIRKYLLWAKLTNPTISPMAEKVLIKEYRKMRERDAGGSVSSWRITVRQLESLIRLSEAMARIYAKDVVTPSHVREAAKLLGRSIVTVEMPDVELEPLEEELELEANAQEPNKESEAIQDENADPNIEESQMTDQEKGKDKSSPEKKSQNVFRMTNNEFQRIRTLILQQVRKREDQLEMTEEDETLPEAYNRENLSNWFLEFMEDVFARDSGEDDTDNLLETFAAFSSLQDIMMRKKAVDSIITRLVQTEHSLVELALDGEKDVKILVINPNIILDSDIF